MLEYIKELIEKFKKGKQEIKSKNNGKLYDVKYQIENLYNKINELETSTNEIEEYYNDFLNELNEKYNEALKVKITEIKNLEENKAKLSNEIYRLNKKFEKYNKIEKLFENKRLLEKLNINVNDSYELLLELNKIILNSQASAIYFDKLVELLKENVEIEDFKEVYEDIINNLPRYNGEKYSLIETKLGDKFTSKSYRSINEADYSSVISKIYIKGYKLGDTVIIKSVVETEEN